MGGCDGAERADAGVLRARRLRAARGHRKLELVDESVEILPGIRLDRVQGHTRGTQTVRVSAGRETLFFSSDFMPDRHHLPLPWIPAFDLYPLDTLAAKKPILARAVSDGWFFAF